MGHTYTTKSKYLNTNLNILKFEWVLCTIRIVVCVIGIIVKSDMNEIIR